jgi:2',3'-cyclic-nucleotide 2'-phosphodiesterase (5'-nucleotidase family)
MPFLLAARAESDFYFDTGDAIKTGNLGVPLKPEPVWGLFAEAKCDASVIGNRETHILESVFNAKLAGAVHPVLCANLRRRDGSRPLPQSLIVARNGVRVGVFGVSVPMVTERMATQSASAFLWDPPVDTADRMCRELRPDVDLLIALTHIGHSQDLKLAAACPSIDIVLGGHSHTVLQEPERVGKTWVCQGGSHARFIGRYAWSDGELSGGLVPWAIL